MKQVLKAGNRQIDLSVPVCMGIINVTPDSFSDGAQLQRTGIDHFEVDLDLTLSRAEKMVRDGAIFIDIGGESTRPGAETVSVEEQLARVIPVIEAIHKNLDVCISVDTSSADVISEAITAGAELVNDIRALTNSGALQRAVESDVAICLMHMQGQPRTMQTIYKYDDVVKEVIEFLQQRVQSCIQAGVGKDRLLVDPGFGFGKSSEHNFKLLKHLSEFASIDVPLLVGISRKSMIGGAIDRPVDQRLAGSIAATTLALIGGARIIRTHDVAATLDAIRVNCAYLDA
ncbi:MAG: dihydropteroate synthase [Proteobacteria bacterium]|nr:dihydropteroate synthase [Pseudomonadota bacterium]